MREGVKAILEDYPEFAVVAEAGSAAEGVRLSLLYKPDIVLLDMKMPGNGGLKACKEIVAALPQTRVIILTGYDDIESLMLAIEAGAVGYVRKDMTAEPLVKGLKFVARGGALLDREFGMAIFGVIRERHITPLSGVVAMADFINGAFSVAELKDLCLRLGVEYDNLEGATHHERAADLTLYFERRGGLEPLEQMVKRLRPHYQPR